jgi:hypothetical protein
MQSNCPLENQYDKGWEENWSTSEIADYVNAYRYVDDDDYYDDYYDDDYYEDWD